MKKNYPQLLKGTDIDMIWYNCRRMWKWVSEHRNEAHVNTLKRKWLQEHGFKRHMHGGCFFCDAASSFTTKKINCKNCPGKKVDPKFRCMDNAYHYENKSKEFYEKIVELDNLRLARKTAFYDAKKNSEKDYPCEDKPKQ